MERKLEASRTDLGIDFDAERLADVDQQIKTIENEGRMRAVIRDGSQKTAAERFNVETAPTVLEDRKRAEVLRAELVENLPSSADKNHSERGGDSRFHSPKDIASLKAQEGLLTAWQNIKNAPRDAWRMLFGKRPTITKSEAPMRAAAQVPENAPLKAEVFIDRGDDSAQMMQMSELQRLRKEAARLNGIADAYKGRGDAVGEAAYRERAQDADRLADIEEAQLEDVEEEQKAA